MTTENSKVSIDFEKINRYIADRAKEDGNVPYSARLKLFARDRKIIEAFNHLLATNTAWVYKGLNIHVCEIARYVRGGLVVVLKETINPK